MRRKRGTRRGASPVVSVLVLGYSLTIAKNEALESIKLPSLESVDGELSVLSNTALTSVRTNPSRKSAVKDAILIGNDCLSQEDAEAFASTLEAAQTTDRVKDNGHRLPCDAEK